MLVRKLFIAYAITCLKKMQIAIFNGVSYYYYACDSECVYDVHEYGNQVDVIKYIKLWFSPWNGYIAWHHD